MNKEFDEKQAYLLYKILDKILADIHSADLEKIYAFGITVNFKNFKHRFKKIDLIYNRVVQSLSMGFFQQALRNICLLNLKARTLKKDAICLAEVMLDFRVKTFPNR
jgi:hypothetical protein